MKLQFAFGNPRRGKRKKVAKLKKPKKTKGMRKKSKGHRKNPAFKAFKKDASGKRVEIGSGKYLDARAIGELQKAYYQGIEDYAAARRKRNKKTDAEKDAARQRRIKSTLAYKKGSEATLKAVADLEKLKAEGAEIEFRKLPGDEGYIRPKKEKGQSVAKEKGKKVSKKASKKATKKASKKVTKKASKKATKKASKKGKSSKRKMPRMIAHRHAATTRHLKKGSTTKAKIKKGKAVLKFGRKKATKIAIRISKKGKVMAKVNPYHSRRNPVADQLKKYLGLDTRELATVAIGGALAPVINTHVGPMIQRAVSAIPGASMVPASILGALPTLIAGAALNAIGKDVVKGKNGEYLAMAGEGLAITGIIGLASSVPSMVGLGPMAGINYTPMSGINYTPMSGVEYTPRMGIMPQLNGADFGRMGSADYGGSGGYTEDHKFSRADFGYGAQDEDYDIGDDDMLSDTLAGSMA